MSGAAGTLPAGQVSLRAATDADRSFLYEVYASTRRGELAPLRWSEEQASAFITMQFEAQDGYYRLHYPRAEFLLILLDGEPVGRLYLDRSETEIRIMDIAVLPRHRGHGIGSLLVDRVLDEARRSRRAVTLHVEPDNPAMRLYHRRGFRVAEERGVYWFMEWRPDGAVRG